MGYNLIFCVSKGVRKGGCLPVAMLSHNFSRSNLKQNSIHIQKAFNKCGFCKQINVNLAPKLDK